MDLGLADKVALVVVGSRGIGLAAATMFAGEGARVAIAAREQKVLGEAVAQIAAQGREPLALACDGADSGSVARMMQTVADRLGGIDILVNTIGNAAGGNSLNLTDEEWDDSLSIKLRGQIRCCRSAIPFMRARGSDAIVNVIGHRGKQPDGRALPASVANAGLMNFTIGLAQEEAQHGILVVGVSPAPVGGTRRLQNVFETEARLLGVSGVEAGRRWVSQVALGRAASPEEIASVIVFLASPRDRCGVLRGVPAFVAADCAASGLSVDLGLLAVLRFRDVLPFFAVVRSPEIRNTHPRASYPERVK